MLYKDADYLSSVVIFVLLQLHLSKGLWTKHEFASDGAISYQIRQLMI